MNSTAIAHSYRTWNILTRFVLSSATFGYSYRTRNVLTIFVQKSPSFGKSYVSRNILLRCELIKSCTAAHFTVVESRWSLFLENWLTLWTKGFRQCRTLHDFWIISVHKWSLTLTEGVIKFTKTQIWAGILVFEIGWFCETFVAFLEYMTFTFMIRFHFIVVSYALLGRPAVNFLIFETWYLGFFILIERSDSRKS